MYVKKSIPIDLEPVEEPVVKSNPNRIKMARINQDISDEDIKRYYENYKDWESGEKPTTWNDLRLIAKICHKPSFYYLLKDTEDDEEYLNSFTMLELLDEFENEFKDFKKELFRRIEVCNINLEEDV